MNSLIRFGIIFYTILSLVFGSTYDKNDGFDKNISVYEDELNFIGLHEISEVAAIQKGSISEAKLPGITDNRNNTLATDNRNNNFAAEEPLSWDEIRKNALKIDPKDTNNPNTLIFKNKSLRYELDRIFKKSFPGNKLSLRRYEVLNWPESVPLLKNKWSHEELELIRSHSKRFRFSKRDNKNSSAYKPRITKNPEIDYPRDPSMNILSTYNTILNRFRIESGWLCADNIDWKILDRSQVPSKYDPVVINANTIKLKNFYSNPEIIDNIHFYQYNDEQLVSKIAYKNNLEKRLFKFFTMQKGEGEDTKVNENEEKGDDCLLLGESYDISENFCENLVDPLSGFCQEKEDDCGLFGNANETSRELCCTLSGVCQGSEADNVTDMCEAMIPIDLNSEVPSFESFDIVFGKNKYLKMKIEFIVEEIQKGFNLQFPDEGIFSFKKVYVINWPDSISKIKSKWTNENVEVLRSCVKDFKYARARKLFEDVNDVLLNRFKCETNSPNASKIEWKQLDRSFLPEKYQRILLNSCSIKLPEIHGDMEFVKNIHFSPNIQGFYPTMHFDENNLNIENENYPTKRFIELEKRTSKKSKLNHC